jgi:uncharacterized protein YndB with AHSA1/START domain
MSHDRDPLARARERAERDSRSEGMKPGDWVRFRPMYTAVQHANKLAMIADWSDDGFNAKRAPRNKHVVVLVEPHLYGDSIVYRGRLQEFLPLTEMEVLAVAARG